MKTLLFPVIAWYDIIILRMKKYPRLLLFPVIAWYDIIKAHCFNRTQSCCSQLSLGMI